MSIFMLKVSRFAGLFPYNQSGKFSKPFFIFSIFFVTSVIKLRTEVAYGVWLHSQFSVKKAFLGTVVASQCFAFIIHLEEMFRRRIIIEKLLPLVSSYSCQQCYLCGSLILVLFYITLTEVLMLWDLPVWDKVTKGAVCIAHSMNFVIALHFTHLIVSSTNLFIKEISRAKLMQFFKLRSDFDDTVRSLNEAFGLSLLFNFADAFGFLILASFDVYGRSSPWSYGSIVMKALTVLYPCSAYNYYSQQLDEHYSKVFELMKKHPVLCKKTSLYIYVTFRQKVKVTSCGFFSLGHPLITSIIAGWSTYLVVLIQFSNFDSKKS